MSRRPDGRSGRGHVREGWNGVLVVDRTVASKDDRIFIPGNCECYLMWQKGLWQTGCRWALMEPTDGHIQEISLGWRRGIAGAKNPKSAKERVQTPWVQTPARVLTRWNVNLGK